MTNEELIKHYEDAERIRAEIRACSDEWLRFCTLHHEKASWPRRAWCRLIFEIKLRTGCYDR
jgi:hypothetical protein